MKFPEIVEKLGSLYQMMDARTSMFTKLSRLQGKLDLVLTQITSRDQEEEEDAGKSQQPLLLVQDESSDEDIPLSDILPSESGEDWDDLWDESPDEMSPEESEMNGKDRKDKGGVVGVKRKSKDEEDMVEDDYTENGANDDDEDDDDDDDDDEAG